MADIKNGDIGDIGNEVPDSKPLSETSDKKTGSSLRQRMKDHHYRNNVVHSLFIALLFLALGLYVGQNGPTFLDLQIITGTDIEKASAFFTAGSIGYLTGSVISGVIYNKVNKNLLLFTETFFLGVAVVITPFCSIYELMIFIRFVSGVCGGGVDATGNSEQMRIWGNEGQFLMHLLHSCFGFGGIISPLYSEPFLAEKGNETEAIILSRNSTNSSETLPQTERETDVYIAFIITGVATVASALPFFGFFVGDMIRKKKDKSRADAKVKQRPLPLFLLIFLLLNLCMFYVLYCCVEDTFASFLMTFLVRQFPSVTKSDGAYITAIYWASFAVARFLMIFVSKFLLAVRQMYVCCVLMVIAYTCFYLSASVGAITALSVFAAMAGISMSAIFPAGFLWTESELMKVTGRVSSCILVSASLGTMINPVILGFLMEELGNMWFCYLLLGQTVAMCLVFAFLLLFNRYYVNKHYGSVGDSLHRNSITVDAEGQESAQPLQVQVSSTEGSQAHVL